ncbi:MAG: type I-E CRISPR-associated protein Cas6/Cse3/CasE [Pseudoclavibacter sp.]|nr:type I-E CRISPR-associated protein Cas6/Cse3/CasE [Pseudoclavibacter sp.]
MSHLTTVAVSLLPGVVPGDTNPDRWHRAVMSLFASVPELQQGNRREELEILWRLEPDGSVLVRSATAPTNLPRSARTRPEADAGIAPGVRVLFRITVNAVRRRDAKLGGGTFPVEDVETWLAERLAPGLGELAVFSHDREVGMCRKRRLTVQRDLVDGTALVEDPEALDRLLRHGVGRAKAFGCGLLTVVPA